MWEGGSRQYVPRAYISDVRLRAMNLHIQSVYNNLPEEEEILDDINWRVPLSLTKITKNGILIGVRK